MEKKTPYNPNNKTELPLKHYLGLFAECDPEEIAARTGAKLEGNRFSVRILDEERYITWPTFDDEGWKDNDRILFVRFLLEGKKAGKYDGYLPYRDLPWGPVYDVQFRGRCVSRLARTYGNNPEAFMKACEAIGGIRLKGSGIGYEITFVKGYQLQFYLWEGDDEFPAAAQILFSDNFQDGFSGEDRVYVCEYTINRMKAVLAK